MSEPPESPASEPTKTERKLKGLLRALRSEQRDRVRASLAALPLEKPRVLRAITHQLQGLANANDGCLADLASALCERARNTAAGPGTAKAITSTAGPLFANRRWREAAGLLKLALELDPHSPQVKRQLARALANLGERSNAVAILVPLLVSDPSMVSAATVLARQVDANQMAEIAKKIGPLAVAQADANPALTAKYIQVLIRLMCFDEAATLVPRLGSLDAPAIAKAAFDIGINTNDATLASRALQERCWQPGEQRERDVWLSQLALLQGDRQALAAPFERLSAAGSLDFLGKSRRPAGQALGRYAEAFIGNWNWTRRSIIGRLAPHLFRPDETLESLAGTRVLIIACTELGDEIYPLELVDRISEACASCTIVVDRRIAGLVARNRDNLIVFGTEKLAAAPTDNPVPDILRRHLCPEIWLEIDRFEKVLLIQDLQPLLVRTEEDLPKRPKTLEASPELLAKWLKELGRKGPRPRIGLFWRSGRTSFNRTGKSTHLKAWSGLLKDFQGSVVSLQFGPGVSEEIAAFADIFPVIEIPGLDTRDDLESVAALMTELDLIVTIPGTTMHLAGALGVPTLAVSHPSQILERTRLDGKTGTWSRAVEVVSGPWEMGFDGAIQSASQWLHNKLSI